MIDNKLERIQIQSGDPAFFVKKETGEEFVPKGANLIRLINHEHSTFVPGEYASYAIEKDLKLMSEYNYNTVRVFITGRYQHQPGIAGDLETTTGLDQDYMDNVVDFLEKAYQNNLYVIFTMCYIPINKYFLDIAEKPVYQNGKKVISGRKNPIILSKGGVEAKKEYIERFLTYIQQKNPKLFEAVFSIQIENEEFFVADEKPFSLTEGILKTADGKSYDMSDSDSRQKCADNNSIYYMNEIKKTVKDIDSELLVSQSVFSHKVVGKDYQNNHGLYPLTGDNVDNRYPVSIPAMAKSNIDFISYHYYPYTSMIRKTNFTIDDIETELKQKLASSGFESVKNVITKKPFMMGEFGAFKNLFNEPSEALESLTFTVDCSYEMGFRGWLLWTFNTFEQENLWNGQHEDGLINKALAQVFLNY